jgi:spermidine synthase
LTVAQDSNSARQTKRHTVAIFGFFLSGFSGLIYEVCWIRMASLVFGSTIFALSTVLAVFFFGLALGSYWFGRIGQRSDHPLRLFAGLELAIGLLALISPHAFDAVDALYGVVFRSWGDQFAILTTARILLISLVLLPPTVLMGGTLPLFCRHFVVDESRIANSVALLYGVNTLGAAVGCATTGFLLLPEIGVRAAIWVGFCLNLIVGIGVISLRLRGCPIDRTAEREKPTEISARDRGVVGLLVFLSGFVVLGNEVLWTRYLALLVRNTVYTYTTTLTVVLAGIVLGSVLIGRCSDRWKSRPYIFGLLQVTSGILVLAAMLLPPSFWDLVGYEKWWIYLVVLLPPAVLTGASFPLAVRLVVVDPSAASSGVGGLTAINTLGGIAGSLLVGFIILPVAGLHRTLLCMSALGLVTGFVAWALLDCGGSRLRRRAVAVGACAIWLGLPVALGTRIPADFLAHGGELIAYREGLNSNLAVLGNGSNRTLEIDLLWQGTDANTHQAVVADHLLLLHPNPRRVLVVGVGAGKMPERALSYDVDELDCVDIEPAVFDVIRDHFDARWMTDPRVGLIRADGRSFLVHTPKRYDAIAIEVGQISRPGIAFFDTAEFYRSVRTKLTPGGLLTQFVPLAWLTPEQFRSVVATFIDSFPQASLWYNTWELILMGTNGEETNFDTSRLELLTGNPEIRRQLRYAHWGGRKYNLNRPEVFLASFLSGPKGLAAMAGAALIHDDRPILDHAVFDSSITDVVDLIRENLQPVDRWLDLAAVDPSPDPGVIEKIREKNLDDLLASALIRRANAIRFKGSIEQRVQLLAEAVQHNPESFQAQRKYGDVLMQQQRLDEARSAYKAALRIKQGNAYVRNALDQLEAEARNERAGPEP